MGFTYQLATARTGVPTLKVSAADGKEKYFHSPYDPVGEAARWVDRVGAKRATRVFIVLGLGLGYHVRVLREAVPESSVLVFEPCLPALPGDTEWLAGNERVRVCRSADEWEVRGFLQAHIHTSEVGSIQVLPYQPAVNLAPDVFKELLQVIFKTVQDMEVDLNTTLFFARQWTENFFRNLGGVQASLPARGLERAFTGQPAIIVAAGPSLDKNIHLLPQAKGRALIVAVGTSLKPVIAQGIEPDLVVSIDGGEPNYAHFKDLSGLVNVPLVYDPSIYPRILDEYAGPKVMAAVNPFLKRWFGGLLNEMGELPAGPSVANVAFGLVVKMGCNPIILVGQDLAYPGGRSHARGTAWEHANPLQKQGLLEVEDIHGGKVTTDRSLYSMLIWLENAVATWAADRRVIDATEGGARIRGTEIMPLGEVLKEALAEAAPTAEILQDRLHAAEKLRSETWFERLRQEIASTAEQLIEVKRLAREGARQAHRLANLYAHDLPKPGRLAGLNKRLDSIDKAIKECQRATPLLEMIFQQVYLVLSNGFRAVEGESELQQGRRVATMSQALYKGILQTAETVQNAIGLAGEVVGGETGAGC